MSGGLGQWNEQNPRWSPGGKKLLSPASPSPQITQAITQDTAGSTERLLYSMILILQDLISLPLGTFHLPIQSAKKKKKNRGSFSYLSSASQLPPSSLQWGVKGRRVAFSPVPK